MAEYNKKNKMSVTQLTLLTSLSMMGAGIIMLPAKLASLGTISSLSWLLTATGATAIAYVFAQCGMLSRKSGGMGGFAEYAFGRTGSYLVNYTYGVSLVIGNMAIAMASVNYGLYAFNVTISPTALFIATLALLWLSTLLNFLSPAFTGHFTASVIWALLLPLLLLILIGPFWFSGEMYMGNWNPQDQSWWEVLPESFSMMLWAFLGLESACANAEAVDEPEKNVPKAVLFATLLTAFIYISTTSLIAGIVPNASIEASNAPFGVVYGELLGGTAGTAASCLLWVGCMGSLVTWQFTLGRVFKSSADVGFFPAVFSKVTSNNATVSGLVILTLLQSVFLIPAGFVETFSAYEALTELTVGITVFAFALCVCGSHAMGREEGISRGRMHTLRLAIVISLLCVVFTLCWLPNEAVKEGFLILLFGWIAFAFWSRSRA
ncbi:MAG: putrescine-ornithine antiporter [Sutterella sp.]|nr:putrescine-ornithine antiporter [Sutterella sp.]MDO5531553.1 putrescine-ornithine antiporter [Sutterella sp.]